MSHNEIAKGVGTGQNSARSCLEAESVLPAWVVLFQLCFLYQLPSETSRSQYNTVFWSLVISILYLDFLFMTIAALKDKLKWLGFLVTFILCYFGSRLRLPAETLGILSVLPASTFFLSWCAPVVLQCLSSSRVAFSLVRVDYSDFETGESVLLPLSQPKCSLPSGAADLLCVDWLPEAAAVGLHRLSCPFYRLTSALFLWHYFVGMLTSCFDSKKWVCINWENVLAHLRILYEPIRQLPPSRNWDLAG